MDKKTKTTQAPGAEVMANDGAPVQTAPVDSAPVDSAPDTDIAPDETGASPAATYGKGPEEIAPPEAPAKGRGRAAKAAATPTVPAAIEREARAILKDYPAEREVFMTSDGFGFFDRHDAVEHARGLTDCEVTTIKREEE